MTPEVADRLRAVNQAFYKDIAEPFARSRAFPQPGYSRLLSFLPQPCPRFLDAGCGEGRFGRLLQKHSVVDGYVGIDTSAELLAHAREQVEGHFYLRDLSRTDALQELGLFTGIACLSTLQHIPRRDNRLRLLLSFAEHLQPHGVLFLANWQFLSSSRQRRKIVPWTEIGLQPEEVEPGDYLLSWKRGREGFRYVAAIDLHETQALAREAGLHVTAWFRSDGKEGDLNLYTVLRPVAERGEMVPRASSLF